MKKPTLILAILMATTLAKGQSVVTEFWHEENVYFNFHNIVEASDNTIIAQCALFESMASGLDLGCKFFKISMDGQLLDSLFIPSNNVPFRTLFEPSPMKDVFLYGRFSFNEANNTTCLLLTFIDKNLNIVEDHEVALEDTLNDQAFHTSDLFIDPNNDIIVSYHDGLHFYMLRIGLDGTLKNKTAIPINGQFSVQSRHTGLYSTSPLRYFTLLRKAVGSNEYRLQAYIVDSLFTQVDEHQYYKITDDAWFDGGFQEHAVSFDDSCYLFSSRAQGWINYQFRCFIALAKYDRNHNIVDDHSFFVQEQYNSSSPVWTVVAAPDTIYYSYMTNTGASNQLALACLDVNLNVRWERYIYNPDMFHWATCMRLLRNGKVAIGSYQYGEVPCKIFVVIVEDMLWETSELQDFVRPYTYYPNPAQDELHLHYSPDVTPTQIELYDLQGRLVRTQKNGLESLEMDGLPSGTYTMRVTLEGGKGFSDKVVKN